MMEDFFSSFFSSFGAAFFFFFFAAERSLGPVPLAEAARTGVRLVVPRKPSAAMVAIILRMVVSLSVVQFEAVDCLIPADRLKRIASHLRPPRRPIHTA